MNRFDIKHCIDANVRYVEHAFIAMRNSKCIPTSQNVPLPGTYNVNIQILSCAGHIT